MDPDSPLETLFKLRYTKNVGQKFGYYKCKFMSQIFTQKKKLFAT